MDVSNVASSAIKSLVPYFEPAQASGMPLGEEAPATVRAIWSKILSVFGDDPEAASALKGLTARPTEPDAQTSFREKLEEMLEGDAVLRAELEASVTANDTRAGAYTPPERLVRLDPEDTGAYPRPLPARRRCEG